MRSYDDIKNSVIIKGYKWFEGIYQVNMIWERTSDEITNHFTDWLHIAYVDDKGKQVLTIPSTTKPGLKGSILEPVTVQGITGTAIIRPCQYVNGWKFKDTDKEFSSYPYFRQVGGFNYWRDGNKDTHIDRTQEQNNKIFGTHGHRMSQNNTYGSGLVNNWSLGCMGAPEPEWKKILLPVRKHVHLYGDLFSPTLLETKDFI